ncbi:30S ribosomal protein S21 [Candidatus Roizmanbacteria bacterium CG_4_9_14_0_2_um_filter_39_13]|uniref:Small ribosomal subunit protein bS21 n=1 Tax=Candidatus Roizmanbacteria bacterium CG_4_9_14_0_2_um_filter_39_13 TaxID=1974839 RepID=A0A2M8F045_9BACT|nr:MAG: 30S ribosomal protein S21 [Candidatus Roizmanbacteria bacterium CG_4_10_14_0_2_um_filter_39_12]PJC32637.1 MAG: 30S ribosomal protein S21 [Candidatus Roizmanbacteria bacterium CG_4_9_14_0_2_um_filter_39_13]
MVVVTNRKGKSSENMFREFSRRFFESKIVDEVRGRMYYKRPSQVRKEEKIEQIKSRHKKRTSI